MFKKIISTVFARALLAGLNFFLVIITTRYLGAVGKGDVSLFMLNLTIVQLVNSFIGGPYLVYLVSRKNIMHLLLPSYSWAFISSIIVPVILFLLHLQDVKFLLPLIIISLLYSVISINTMIMTGKEEVNKYNITSLLQTFLLVIFFLIAVKVFEIKNLPSYVNSLCISSAFAFFLSFIFILKHFEKISLGNILETFYETIKKGFIIQTANIAQLFNYRLSFYILDKFHEDGRKEVGIYSVAVSVAEALWLISQSVSLVLYSKISNTNDIFYSRKITIALIKIVFILTIFCTGILLCFPSSLFVFVFGKGFGEVKMILFPLSIGIIIFSAGIILSAYFVGLGNPQVSVIASIIGLAVTIILGLLLIPKYGMTGAAITASISYTAGVIYQFVLFFREAKEIQLRDFILSANDIRLIIAESKIFLQPPSKIKKPIEKICAE